ncbi:TATA box-binding protein-associated factor RNA polymerase I subunit B isoform X1 [Myxocyprinus asiaticus]|uniref:TATA box-binding protein-associated factor RNA polymerase I subunit B isoform X1 n=1 Tax=Myxocyprinus asiaticus TaxID=70543 RepID=UPI002223E07E|nr:TATA box-binding protein-associated factor RNA polymerase I subunit B isoform X1 [Myxocyprinus asiaticus]
MDEQLTCGYSEPCGQCAVVDWGVSDGGHFFCKNCHNVIEKTREVEDNSTQHIRGKISRISKPKKSGKEGVREWVVCEGFQFILKHQADALVNLGVCKQFKTEVLWNFWKRYLQNTRQAYTKNPVYTPKFTVDLTSESEPESMAESEQSFQSRATSEAEGISASGSITDRQALVCSGSLDALSYVNKRESRSLKLMTMPRTLALCYLALLWVREAITLADLLRMVSERHVPYLNLHEDFPAEMRLFGRDTQIFRVESLPSYSVIHGEAVYMAKVMNLPSFPAVSQDCLLQPTLLTVRYLLESNLPDSLHVWVCKVIDQAAMGIDSFLTFDPLRRKPRLICYDILAVAVIIVTMKLLFKLDDQEEWRLSDVALKRKKKKAFNLRKWFNTVQPAIEQAKQKRERAEARRQWKSSKPLIPSLKNKSVVLKKRRVVEHLQHRFQKLTDSSPKQSPSTTDTISSFHFHWGKEEFSDGPSMHHHRLNCTLKKEGVKCLANRKYWHADLKPCPPKFCGDHYSEIEPSLPRMYVWLLDFFSFLLGVTQAQVHKEVINVERRFLKRR